MGKLISAVSYLPTTTTTLLQGKTSLICDTGTQTDDLLEEQQETQSTSAGFQDIASSMAQAGPERGVTQLPQMGPLVPARADLQDRPDVPGLDKHARLPDAANTGNLSRIAALDPDPVEHKVVGPATGITHVDEKIARFIRACSLVNAQGS